MHYSQLYIGQSLGLITTSMDMVEVVSILAAFAPKFDALSGPSTSGAHYFAIDNSIKLVRLCDVVSAATKQKKRQVRIGFSSLGELFSYVT